MPANQNEVAINMVMDIKDYDEQLKKAEKIARDTGKAISQELVVKMRLDIDDLQQKLVAAKAKLKAATDPGKAQALRLDIAQYTNNLTEAKRQLNNYVNTGDKSLSRLQAKFDGLGSGLKDGLLKAAGAIGSVFAVGKFKELSDTFIGMQNSLRQVAEGPELDTLQKKILALANESRVPVDSLTNSFVRYDKVIKAMGGTQEETFTIMDSLSKALTSTGRTAEETSSVMLQLSQAFGSGKLQGDEFRSLSENMPQIMDILAKSMNVPRGSLKELSSEGKITAEVLKKALIEANGSINEQFSKSQVTISQKLTQIRNDFIIAFGEFDKASGFTDAIVSGLGVAQKAIGGFVKEFPLLTIALGGGTLAVGVFSVAVALLGGPLTIIISTVAMLVTGIGYLSSVILDVQTQIGDLQTKLEENKTAQDNLKKSYDDGKISLQEYQKKSAELIVTQEELKKKNEELEGSFSYMFASIVSGVRSAFSIFAGVVGTALIAVGEGIGNTLGFIIENLKLIPYNFGVAFNNIPGAIESGLKLALKAVGKFINAVTLGLGGLISEKLGLGKMVDDFNMFGSKNMEFKGVGIGLSDFKLTQKAISELGKEFENFGKIKVKSPIIGIPVGGGKGGGTKEGDETKKTINNLETLKKELDTLKKKLEKEEIGSVGFKKLQEEIKNTQSEIDKANGKLEKSSGKKKKTAEELQKELDKIAEEAKKKELERQIEVLNADAASAILRAKNSTMTELEKAKQIVKINEDLNRKVDALKQDSNKTELEMAKDFINTEEEKSKKVKEGQQKIQEFYDSIGKGSDIVKDKIKDLKTQIEELNKELNKSTENKNTNIAQRRLDILEREKEIQAEIAKMKKAGADINFSDSISQEMLNQFSPGSMIGSMSVEDIQKVKDLQKELSDLQAEQIKNTSALDQKTFDELQTYKNLTKTEQILADFEKEKADIEAKLKLKQDALTAEETQLKSLDAIKRNVESTFTAFLKVQTDERINQVDRLKQAGLEAIAALKELGVAKSDLVSGSSTSTTTVAPVINQTNNFSAKLTQDDMKTIKNQIAKDTANAATGIK